MTMKKGFPKLLVPRPDPSKTSPAYKPQPAVAPEAVMHDCRPVDHVKPVPRIVPPMPAGHIPVRPVAPPPAPTDTRPKPSFLMRGKPEPTPASEQQTGGYGKVTTPAAPQKVTVPTRPSNNFMMQQTAALRVTTAPPPIKLPTAAPVHKGYRGRQDLIDPAEIPF